MGLWFHECSEWVVWISAPGSEMDGSSGFFQVQYKLRSVLWRSFKCKLRIGMLWIRDGGSAEQWLPQLVPENGLWAHNSPGVMILEVFFWNGLLLPVIFVTGHDLRPLGLGNGMGNENKTSYARTDTLKFEERRLGVPFSPLLSVSTYLRGFFAHGRISIQVKPRL